MKYIIFLGDGMADEPMACLGGKTPLQAARTPHMDALARDGRCGALSTVPQGFIPGSEIANMSLLGYDVRKDFEGRGSLEAASMGVEIPQGCMAARCNLICMAPDGRIKNHSAGHISNDEAEELIAALNEALGENLDTEKVVDSRKANDSENSDVSGKANDSENYDASGKACDDQPVRFFPGISYRHLLLLKGGDKRILCTPPHDVPGTPFRDVLVKPQVPEAAATANRLNELIIRSQEILSKHPVNLRRISEGKDPANSIWPWSPGYRPSMLPMTSLYPIRSGSVISAVDLIKGIGVYAGLESIEVEGATGLFDTNYEGKAAAAVRELRRKDFVFVHVEASDEASHEGDVDLKIKTIEYLDRRLIAPVLEALPSLGEPVTVAVLPDHPTFCRTKTHVAAPVPFLIWRSDGSLESDAVTAFSEEVCRTGAFGQLEGDAFIRAVFGC